MKNKLLAIATACFAIIAFASCKKPVSQLALYVPKDASAVFVIDTKAVLDKIALSGITIDSLADLFKQNDALHWSGIRNSGIDINKPLYAFFKQTNSIEQGNIKTSGLIAQVEDEKKVEAFFKKEKVDGTVLQSGKYKYIALGNDYVAGWTDKILIISNVTGGNNSPGKYSTGEGTLSQLQLTTLFTQKESASIASLGEFRDVAAKPGDVHFYSNASANLNAMPMPGITKLNSLLQDSYTEGTINFEKGKITETGETHYNKKLSDILDKYPSKGINKDMIKNYPGALTGFGIISFNPKMLVEILRYMGFDIMADSFTSSLGFTTNDVVNAFSGDIAVMFSSRSNATTEKYGQHNSGFLLNLTVGDKAAFNKVLNGLLSKQILTKTADGYQLGLAGGHGFVIQTGNDNLFIASSYALVKAYQSSGEKAGLAANVEKQISNKTMAIFIDINNLLQNKSETDSSADMHFHGSYYSFNVAKAAKATFKNFIVTADKGNGKTIQSNGELNFVNTSENSLAALAKFIAVVRAEDLKRKPMAQAFSQDYQPKDTADKQ